MKNTVYRRMLCAMEIPEDIAGNAALVEITGQNRLRVENFCRILEYSASVLLLQCRGCRLEICGKQLTVEFYTKEELVLAGKIEQIRYL